MSDLRLSPGKNIKTLIHKKHTQKTNKNANITALDRFIECMIHVHYSKYFTELVCLLVCLLHFTAETSNSPLKCLSI